MAVLQNKHLQDLFFRCKHSMYTFFANKCLKVLEQSQFTFFEVSMGVILIFSQQDLSGPQTLPDGQECYCLLIAVERIVELEKILSDRTFICSFATAVNECLMSGRPEK